MGCYLFADFCGYVDAWWQNMKADISYAAGHDQNEHQIGAQGRKSRTGTSTKSP